MDKKFCPGCGSRLEDQPGFDPAADVWVCAGCGRELHSRAEAEPSAESPETDVPAGTVGIQCLCDPQFALAMHQNSIPLIRSLRLTNKSEKELKKLRIGIGFSPAFAAPYTANAELIEPGETVEISPVRITILPEFISSLTERVAGAITVTVRSEEGLLASESFETTVLASDQWTGINVMPELTAAFITPNHPAITQIINRAAHYLMKWTGDPSFTGYQTQDPNKARLQMAAVYAALQEENIAYTMPPASFETMGQRVRMPHTVLSQKCGTCLDLALLFCACTEAAGLSPLLIVQKSHAFAACWLSEETFSNCAVDDPAALTKRTAEGINLICPVECTAFAAAGAADFDGAVRSANETLAASEKFELAIDIKRCRGNGIRPLPLTAEGKYDFSGFGKRQPSEITASPAAIDPSALRYAEGTAKAATKQEVWERKLLDISLRNSLINFVPGSSNVQLVTADLGKLEDELARGESFKIMPAPSELSVALTDQKIYRTENNKDLISSIADAEFASKRLRTFLKEDELDAALKKLHRKARLSLEENGANTLYLALGFLCWYETEKSTKRRYSPLVLVPVDIIRKISDKAYSLRIRSEDTQMNITLLEMLRQDHGIRIDGLDPLPVDESGVDLQMVFNTMRRAVMQNQRWDIEELAFLGQFSFGRFIMWNDIRNRCEELKNNKVVASLISGKMEWQPKDIDLSPSQIDLELDPLDIAVPTSADSSQMAAVCAAGEGESFVLHGPPGTGKSQTITNMIANALYHGRSVLFVAEKMAALSVVQERLKKLGLDPFCLELHSNKALKRSVLDQLAAALEVGRLGHPEGYEAEAGKLRAEKQELLSLMKALHEKRPIGLSLYEAITVYERHKEYDGAIRLTEDINERITPENYAKAQELIKRISVAGEELGGLAFSPLRSYRRTDHSFDLKDRFVRLSGQYGECVRRAAESYDALCAALEMEGSRQYDKYTSTVELMSLAAAGEYLSPAVFGRTAVTDDPAALDSLVSKTMTERQISSELLADFDRSILSADAESMKLAWNSNAQKWFIGRALGKRKLLKGLRSYAKNAENVTEEGFVGICEKVSEYQKLKAETDASAAGLAPCLGTLWQGEATDFGRLAAYRSNTVRMHSLLQSLGGSSAAAVSKAAAARAAVSAAASAYRPVTESQAKLVSEYKIDLSDVFAAEDWFSAAEKLSEGFVSGSGRLRERSVLEGLMSELDSLGLGELSVPYRKGYVSEEDYLDAFVCAAARMTVVSAMSADSRLSSFQGAQFEVSLAQYRETMARYRELTVKELIARLSAKVPASADGMRQGSSETAILQKAIKSGGRSLSIRSLFESIPTLLRRICPCMLMSPISVAQYIDPKYPKFDLVIFDEASQMPTSEAVGAMARGENVVVVGDPRQLPPTSFFAAQNTDEDNLDKEDLESVLDDCLALNMPQKHLLWHYRSRHESLIAFSNARFYENKLRTFPSPDDRKRKVTRVQIEGCYDKSGTRQNRAEAEAVVAEIVRRLSDEKLRKYSIGVVTFSSVQQNLIDDLLADAFVRQPELEEIADKMYEPIFIKNLENVQGDERDVILFSIGYGPDKNGKVSMNFGPLNQDGGWRRLNVAVSRARREMTVYSVLRPDQIDLTRTQAAGVAELKYFLEFAERGAGTLARNAGEAAYETDSFAKLIAEELTKRGYEVRCGVGCSDFRIDIGVLDPEKENEFILGIMLGGGRAFRSASTDDIRITQPSVLSGLGWDICNVHILDWLDDSESVMEKLIRRIEEARQGKTPEAETAANISVDIKNLPKEKAADTRGPLKEFAPCVLPIMGDAESFILPRSQKKIASAISRVIVAEAPLSLNSLTKNVLSAWGIVRKSKAVTAAFESALSSVGHKETESGEFIWREDQAPEGYNEFRTGTGSGKRRMEDICIEEICAAVMYVLDAQINMPKNDLLLATANLFGYTRASAVEERVSLAVELAVRRGLAIKTDDRISLF